MIQDSFKITHTGSYTLDPPPTQDSSHHQRIMTSLVGNSYKPLCATVRVGGRSKLHLIHKFWVETTNSCLFENEVLDHKLFSISSVAKWRLGAVFGRGYCLGGAGAVPFLTLESSKWHLLKHHDECERESVARALFSWACSHLGMAQHWNVRNDQIAGPFMCALVSSIWFIGYIQLR